MYKNLLILTSFLFVSCSSPQTYDTQKSNLSVGTIKKGIVENKTTQTEVIEMFGSPNLITTSSEGTEVWSYNKSSYDSAANSKNSGFWLLLASSSSSSVVSSAATASLDLIIKFNKNQTVKEYKVISSKY
ncbi:hypothetical protein ACQ9ZF_04975 [Cetobacterium somerae]|uniref:hypothetical protein n=1 Tax=Cetobacterium somerae TaxID=188913 RepID=UPI003D767B40